MPFANGANDGVRDALDRYETPDYVVEALLKHVRFDGRIQEPCAGSGRMARALRRVGYGVDTDDLDRGPEHDFLLRRKPAQNFVTNPPYSGKLPFLIAQRALELVQAYDYPRGGVGRVALLVKHGFLWGSTRRAWLRKNPPQLQIIMTKRIIFLENDEPIKGQFFDHMWLVWRDRNKVPTRTVLE
jgi:hypothetical protein